MHSIFLKGIDEGRSMNSVDRQLNTMPQQCLLVIGDVDVLLNEDRKTKNLRFTVDLLWPSYYGTG